MADGDQNANATPADAGTTTTTQANQTAGGSAPPAGNAQKKLPPGFLKDDEGKPSSMRLMSLIALFASIGFGWMTLSSNATSQNGVYITTAFLLAAFAPKALQKFIENYYPKG
jgi:hypothetical protein